MAGSSGKWTLAHSKYLHKHNSQHVTINVNTHLSTHIEIAKDIIEMVKSVWTVENVIKDKMLIKLNKAWRTKWALSLSF